MGPVFVGKVPSFFKSFNFSKTLRTLGLIKFVEDTYFAGTGISTGCRYLSLKIHIVM